ncbi:ThiF family adenylyltransferase [Psychrosphaera aestuarii]|uniref:ThiF family adenylyltransferase n=1 Tax=Psychrosphaera aestuarii TaxID=1266052 RepID=UPI001B31FB95|nr:ThiF family adenylyltransferase [Psychrosphaera aestuarii]
MFNYDDAFSRNIGWVTEAEQAKLKNSRIAFAGCGGVGSAHVTALARLGVGNFNISDFDEYEVHNFNRQLGAYMSTIDEPKCSVMGKVIKDINPEADVKEFPTGIFENNVDEFLDNVDIYVDCLDFFALEARKLVFKKCEEKQIPVITAAPLGMGSAYLCFMPGKMSYEQYFRFEDKQTENEQLIQFLIGLSPSMLQRKYLVLPEKADFKAKKGPSTIMGVMFCAAVAASNVLKVLLNRGDVIVAPHGLHFDGYTNKLKKTYLPFGNRGIKQRLMYKIAHNIVNK